MIQEKTYTIAVSGYYGCGNAGDEAVLAGIKAAFRRQSGDRVQLIALSQNPEQTAKQHGIQSANRMDFFQLRSVLRRSDLLLSGGGSLLQDTTSLKSLLYYLWVANMAVQMRVPTLFFAQGMGPFQRPMSRLLVRWTADRIQAITVRDTPSAELLKALGVTRTPIEVTADPAFALEPANAEVVEALWKAEGLKPISTSHPTIGVALRAWGGDRQAQIRVYAELLDALIAKVSADILLIPMQAPNDVDFSREVRAATNTPASIALIQNGYPAETLLAVTERMSAIVAMRLHTLIFAARMAVPHFAMSYDPKVSNLMQLLGAPQLSADWKNFDAANVAAATKELLQHRDAHIQRLKDRGAELERLALRNADVALNLLQRNQKA